MKKKIRFIYLFKIFIFISDGTLKVVSKIAIPANPNTPVGKSQITSQLTSLLSTGNSNKTFIGTRRIYMTKAADGTTRVVSGPTSILPKTPSTPNQGTANQQSLIKSTPTTPAQQIQQKVQIIRGPDGKLQVRGLMPGQQLVQMPDGKLHVLNTGQAIGSPATSTVNSSTTATTPAPAVKTVVTKITPAKAAAVKLTQNAASPTPTTPRLKATPITTMATPSKSTIVVANPGQLVQGQMITSAAQMINTNQIVVNNANLAQQLASGKATLATVGGHQVIIRSTPCGNQIVHLNSSTPGIIVKSAATPKNPVTTQSTAPSPVTPTPAPAVPAIPTTTCSGTGEVTSSMTTTPNAAATPAPAPGSTEASLLASQPPGTVIKCVTAQLIQTTQGPRIVLQGLQGADFTPQQLAMVQQQVKQQLLKAQATTGKQGVLGPTKIYLAVQPAPATPTPTTPVVTPTIAPATAAVKPTTPIATTIKIEKTSPEPEKPKVVVQQVSRTSISEDEPPKTLANGQQPPPGSKEANKFILTPDYIQQTIKNALKQENLNPEIEEKLLQLQRYQEKQMKGGVETSVTNSVTASPATPVTRAPARKRPAPIAATPQTPAKEPAGTQEKDNEWSEPPRKKLAIKSELKEPPKTPKIDEINNDIQKNRAAKFRDVQETRRKQQVHSRMQVLLFRHKELLKKDILKKRALLEKELQIDIQKDLSQELTTRTKAERHKQDEVKVGSAKRKSNAHPPPQISPNRGGKTKKHRAAGATPPGAASATATANRIKKEKLYCLCRTPYDETKFYVGCDLCNNWFHGECVGITEEMSKSLSEFVCTECRHARDTQELYCLCKQPYDESQ